MNLLVDLFLFSINIFVTIFTNPWVFIAVFGLTGIACVVNEYRAVGAFLIFMAVMAFVGVIG